MINQKPKPTEVRPDRRRFFFLILIQVLLWGVILGSYWMIDWTGEPVMLETAPVDPRDFFRGDYVILSYQINNIEKRLFTEKDLQSYERNSSVYVVLEEKGDYFEAVAAHLSKPDSLQSGQKIIRGKVRADMGDRFLIEYGIERFYLEENRGQDVEELRDELDVEVLVTSSGRSKVNRLFYRGEPVVLE